MLLSLASVDKIDCLAKLSSILLLWSRNPAKLRVQPKHLSNFKAGARVCIWSTACIHRTFGFKVLDVMISEFHCLCLFTGWKINALRYLGFNKTLTEIQLSWLNESPKLWIRSHFSVIDLINSAIGCSVLDCQKQLSGQVSSLKNVSEVRHLFSDDEFYPSNGFRH